jgi:ppGpp synthetase/RelA/SpoT-type nucleotidyltranferase
MTGWRAERIQDGSASGPVDPAAVAMRERYRQRLPRQQEFTAEMLRLIGSLLREEDIDVVQLEARTKTVDSLLEKVRRKTEKYADPLDQITDLTGIRIVTYYLEDLPRVAAILAHEFEVDWDNTVDWRSAAEPEQFGYESSHYIVCLPARRLEFGEWRAFAGFRAEVQVRTALQHTWASISHKLVYKRDELSPAPLRRRLARLSALLGLADEQFSELAREAAELQNTYTARVSSGELDIPLDPLSLRAYTGSPEVRRAVTELAQAGGWVLIQPPDSAAIVEQDTRDLLRVCAALGVETVGELGSAALAPAARRTVAAFRKLRQPGSVDTDITAEDLLTRLLIVHRRADLDVFGKVYRREVVDVLQKVLGQA